MIIYTEPEEGKTISKIYLVEAYEDNPEQEIKNSEVEWVKFGPHRCLSKEDIKDLAKQLASLTKCDQHSELIEKLIINSSTNENNQNALDLCQINESSRK